eukprot:9483078-Pyramimonas_sp.AAC.1
MGRRKRRRMRRGNEEEQEEGTLRRARRRRRRRRRRRKRNTRKWKMRGEGDPTAEDRRWWRGFLSLQRHRIAFPSPALSGGPRLQENAGPVRFLDV